MTVIAAAAPAEQVLTEFGRRPNSWLWPVTWRSVGFCVAAAPAEQVLTEWLWPVTWRSVGFCVAAAPAEQVRTEFRLAAKRRPPWSFEWNRKVDQ